LPAIARFCLIRGFDMKDSSRLAAWSSRTGASRSGF
jgi:hypothetical protein